MNRWRKRKPYFVPVANDKSNQAEARKQMADQGFKFGQKYAFKSAHIMGDGNYAYSVMFSGWFGNEDSIQYTYYDLNNRECGEGWDLWHKFRGRFLEGALISDFEKRTWHMKRSVVLSEMIGEHKRECVISIPMESTEFMRLSLAGNVVELNHQHLMALHALIEQAITESEKREMEALL